MFNKERIISRIATYGEKIKLDLSIRVKSIFIEAERLGIEFISHSVNNVEVAASWKGLRLEGQIDYETRAPRNSRWSRPRVTLRLWVRLYNKEQVDYNYFDFNGKIISRSWRRSGYGSEALAIVFGNKRMMTYNRLMTATLNCMGK